MIQFILLVNKQGQTRLAQYTSFMTIKERAILEGELIRKCLSRNEKQVNKNKIKLVFVLRTQTI